MVKTLFRRKVKTYLFFTDIDCLGRISLAIEVNVINWILFFHSIIHVDNLPCKTKKMAFVNVCLKFSHNKYRRPYTLYS